MRAIDIIMLAAMLFLMGMQVTKQEIHEWLGIGLFVLVIAHHILNRKYYSAVFKGKYTPLRAFMLIVNTALLLSFIATPTTGMLMSRYATPFLNSVVGTALPRKLHLMLTYWSFVLMGMHAGLHLGIISSKLKNKSVKVIAFMLMCVVSGYGFYLFAKANIFEYMLMKTQFAFLDYSKPAWQIIIENLAMLLAWALATYLITIGLKNIKKKKEHNER